MQKVEYLCYQTFYKKSEITVPIFLLGKNIFILDFFALLFLRGKLFDYGRSYSSKTSICFLSIFLLCLLRIISCLILIILLQVWSRLFWSFWMTILIVLHLMLSFKLLVRSMILVFLTEISLRRLTKSFRSFYLIFFQFNCLGASMKDSTSSVQFFLQ